MARTILNEPILFGRCLSGQILALQNRCPHRAIPLDRGGFDGHEISCGYHGWRFAPTGKCTAIPSLLESFNPYLDKLWVQSYPVVEQAGNVWILMASQPNVSLKSQPPIPTVWDENKPVSPLVTQMEFDCGVDPAVVLLVDPAHIPFVHNAWWWKTKPTLSEEVKTFDPSAYGFTMRRHRLLEANFFYRLLGGTPEVEISFYLPGIRVERITTAKHSVCNVTTVTPITTTQTMVTNLLYATMPWLPLVKPLLAPLAGQFLSQDRDIIAQPEPTSRNFPTPAEIFIKDADIPVRWYYQLKQEFGRSRAEQRPFVNPVKTQTLRWYS